MDLCRWPSARPLFNHQRKVKLGTSKVFLVLLVAGCSVSRLFAQADIILKNATIITIQSKGHRAEAIAIKGDKILSVGSTKEILKLKNKFTKVIDLSGKTIVPGFNDAHLHPMPIYPFESVHANLELSPDKVASMEQLVELLKVKAASTPKGLLIQGFGYQDTKLGGHPTRLLLDKASSEHPIIIRHSSGHISAANSLALHLAGITKETVDPAGGSFDREADGMPNGVCRESAAALLRTDNIKKPALPTDQEELEAYQKCFDNFISKGITSITEAGSSFQKIKIYEALQAKGLSLRINMLMAESILNQVIEKGITQGFGDEKLRISGIKVFHGNSLSGRTCWLNEPYEMINPETGKKDYYGIPPKRSQAQLDSLFAKIQQAGLQIACHSNGDREIEMVLNAYEKIQPLHQPKNKRHRIEHCSVTNASILQRLKNDSIIAVFHSYIFEHGDKMLVYAPNRWPMMHPNGSAINMGISVAQHSDWPISAANPMLRIQSLATRTSAEGIEIGLNQRISAEDAIRLWTFGGAYASFEENSKGTLEAGKLADLVVLSDDPTKTNSFKLKDVKVLQTMIGGKVVYQDTSFKK
jgi:predicted amidohydrolase YtcJ